MIMERGGLGPYRRKGFGFQKSHMSHLLPCSKNIPQKQQRALLKVKYEGATIVVYGAKSNQSGPGTQPHFSQRKLNLKTWIW